ncbi:IMS domain-containing protein [Leptolyngbya sp. FACHB-8]|uniref:IMS domain-containing protein n=1 Tax=unclassified Leptolyngbya TaxID=2650499 RepID=UPI001686AE51|nr:DUF4101 domain-containing protein [Leptolyngbya sp. FACHB-8]
MRIPLDYYRILGLPIQATAEQLQQAHRDRALQLPRREYSEAAIASRKQLLDEAYAVLSDPEQRRLYDSSFLNRTQEDLGDGLMASIGGASLSVVPTQTDPYGPSIDIRESQLVGALLILLELGEYELVLKLGRPCLSGHANLSAGQPTQFDIVRSDILLTVALAYLELGREQWQQGQYESAAGSLEAGQDLLLREGIFASVRGEMQSDLYKLRPYRVLELLSLPTSSERERRQGLSLLQDMLQERGGIDGSGNDQSGLNVDDFLRFIQQLRSYLTASEQVTLFETEARRPSAVATYLAIYALIAKGFAYRQPSLVRRAKHLLLRLGTRQDVHLEQAVCALLLGQTEEANRALELSQEYEPIAFIREHSKGSPDLLPGLCLYSERWLQGEVFPHFRDLVQQQASLKDYFADPQVQTYLEELPNEPESYPPPPDTTPVVGRTSTRESIAERGAPYDAVGTPNQTRTVSGTATMEPGVGSNGFSGSLPTAERVSQLSPEGRLSTGDNGASSPPSRIPTARRSSSGSPPRMTSLSPRSSNNPRLDRMLFLVALGVAGLCLLYLAWVLLGWITRSLGGPTLKGEQLEISINNPPIEIPSADAASAASATGPITVDVARGVLQRWLEAKAAATSPSRDTSKLATVLTGSILAERQAAAQSSEVQEYRHRIVNVEVEEPNPQQPNQAQMIATVVEGIDDEPDEQLRVRYSLVRQGTNWLIQEIEPLGEATAVEEDTTSDGAATSDTSTTPDATSTTPDETEASPDAIAPSPSPSSSPNRTPLPATLDTDDSTGDAQTPDQPN